MSRTQLRNTILFAISLGLCVAVVSRTEWSIGWLRYATYFTTFGAFGAWVARFHAWVRLRWSSPLAFVRDNGPEVALAALVVALVLATHDWEFKVLSDEANMVGVARSLSSDWRYDFAGHAKYYFGSHHFSHYTFDKRPPLFMFLVSLVNSLTGYRLRNIWYVNACLVGLTMIVASVGLRRRAGRPWNLLAVVWAVANPIVLWCASAAGVEPVLGFVWVASCFLALEVLEDPATPATPLFLATIIMVGLARIEAGPVAALLLVSVVVLSRERTILLDRIRDDALVWMAPAIGLSILASQVRVKDYFQGSNVPHFGLKYVLENVQNWRRVLTDAGSFYPFNTTVLVVEIVAVLVLVALVIRNKTALSRAERTAFLVVAALTTSFVVLYSTYYWGQPTKSTSARFYALPLFCAGLSVPLLLRRFEVFRSRPLAVAVVVGVVFAQAVPAAFNPSFSNTTNWRKQHMVVMDYVAPRLPGRSVLLVSALPGQFHVYDVGAIATATFNKERKSILRELDRHLYDEVLVVQDIILTDKKPTKDTTLDPEPALETLYERQYDGSHFIRISRLVGDAAPQQMPRPEVEPSTEPVTEPDPREPAPHESVGAEPG